jgi:pimeloyl-ACP methyl ester carboxylesterase
MDSSQTPPVWTRRRLFLQGAVASAFASMAKPATARADEGDGGQCTSSSTGTLRTRTVRGGGGLGLHVVEAGRLDGPPLLFIHGFNQSHLAWSRQLRSALGQWFRLVAFDLRGHGLSEKPAGVYGSSQLWADDVQAIIQELGLVRPVLVGWSYGGFVISDYVRAYGQGQLGGILFASAATKLGTAEGAALLSQEMLSLIPTFASEDMATGMATLQAFVRLCFQQPLAPEEFYTVLGYNAAVPPHVRGGLAMRTLDNDDVLRSLRLPVLVSHGLNDRIILPESARQIAATVPGARTSFYAGIGHSPFWESAPRFNQELAAFAIACRQR